MKVVDGTTRKGAAIDPITIHEKSLKGESVEVGPRDREEKSKSRTR